MDHWNVLQLKQLARERQLRGYTRLRKNELIQFLRDHGGSDIFRVSPPRIVQQHNIQNQNPGRGSDTCPPNKIYDYNTRRCLKTDGNVVKQRYFVPYKRHDRAFMNAWSQRNIQKFLDIYGRNDSSGSRHSSPHQERIPRQPQQEGRSSDKCTENQIYDYGTRRCLNLNGAVVKNRYLQPFLRHDYRFMEAWTERNIKKFRDFFNVRNSISMSNSRSSSPRVSLPHASSSSSLISSSRSSHRHDRDIHNVQPININPPLIPQRIYPSSSSSSSWLTSNDSKRSSSHDKNSKTKKKKIHRPKTSSSTHKVTSSLSSISSKSQKQLESPIHDSPVYNINKSSSSRESLSNTNSIHLPVSQTKSYLKSSSSSRNSSSSSSSSSRSSSRSRSHFPLHHKKKLMNKKPKSHKKTKKPNIKSSSSSLIASTDGSNDGRYRPHPFMPMINMNNASQFSQQAMNILNTIFGSIRDDPVRNTQLSTDIVHAIENTTTQQNYRSTFRRIRFALTHNKKLLFDVMNAVILPKQLVTMTHDELDPEKAEYRKLIRLKKSNFLQARDY